VLLVDCARCGRTALTVSLIAPFDRDPQAPGVGEPGRLPGQDTIGARNARLSIDGPVKVNHLGLSGGGNQASIDAGDVAGLYDIDPEYAPFRCPTCSKSHCRYCWSIRPAFDEGVYDATYAICPKNHRRKLDD
jgi:hypothetical protein